ncbi:dTDP-glucose 4,6-dehydratase [archaeon]|nr:dTDP-glucose 4,6-dehydratase [archaeon]|tara:strand:+ start:575 stop:1549 length:975 start_codon:yes stop_codon:yes gene_type:complete
MKFLVTGGCGFIGSNFIRYLLDTRNKDKIVNLDALTYAGNPNNLKDLKEDERYKFIKGNICNKELVKHIVEEEKPDVIVNFAAESHNDRAEKNSFIFLKTNILGTQNLLHACKDKNIRFHHISTCEVYGDLELDSKDMFEEGYKYNPKTLYNSSKAGADHVIRAYYHTFKLPVTISICCNNYGPYQYPEKIIPLFATNAMENKKLPLFKSSQNKREWIHVLDHCKAILLIIEKGIIGQTYNVGTGIEKSIENITDSILKVLEKPKSLKKYVPDRLSHDKRYLLNNSKMKKLGWKPLIDFDEGLKETINWYEKNKDWWKPLKEEK